MASTFEHIYPPAGRTTMDGGLNDKYDRSQIDDNESPSCLNVIYSEGAVETRPGTLQFNTASVGTFVCDGLYTVHGNNNAESMVAWFNGTMYRASGTTFVTIPSAQSVFTAGNNVGSAEYQGYAFFGDGSNIPHKYANGVFTRHGVYAPSSIPSVGTASTGSVLSGLYSYKVSYVNSALVESDVTSATASKTYASQNGYLTDIPVAPTSFGVAARRIYRTTNSGLVYYRVATISDNTTTTFEDGVSDAALGLEAPDDQGVPPNYRAIIYHRGRLFVIDPSDNLVKYSEAGNPYVFKALNFRRIGDQTGDIPKTLAVYDNSVIVGCTRSPWMIYMPDAEDTNWQDVRIITQYGSKSHFASFLYNNKLMFAATGRSGADFVGFAALSGNAVEPDVTLLTRSSLGSDLKSSKIETEISDYRDTLAEDMHAIVHKNRAYISAAKGVAATENNRILYFDFSNENLSKNQKFAWAPWTGLKAAFFTVYNDEVYFGCADATGIVTKLNHSAYSDNGTAIDSYIWTKEFTGKKGHENWTKDFRWLNLFYELSGDWSIRMATRTNSDNSDGTPKDISVKPDGSLWGTMVYGVDKYTAGQQAEETKISVGTFKGKRIQFKFSNKNTAGIKFKIIGLNLTYNLRGRR